MHLQIQMQSHPLGHTDTLISGQTSFKCRFYIDSLHCISKDSNSPWLFLSHFFFCTQNIYGLIRATEQQQRWHRYVHWIGLTFFPSSSSRALFISIFIFGFPAFQANVFLPLFERDDERLARKRMRLLWFPFERIGFILTLIFAEFIYLY